MIEVFFYQLYFLLLCIMSMSLSSSDTSRYSVSLATPRVDTTFWKHANLYTSKIQDNAFVGEIAYVIVTLHKTGA